MKTNNLQTKFGTDVRAFVDVAEQFGNPFCYKSNDLFALNTKEMMEEIVVISLRHLKQIGKDIYGKFMSETIEQDILPISNIIKRQKVLTFANNPVRNKKRRKPVVLRIHPPS